jgi:nicotinate phosphoribosyltransferase
VLALINHQTTIATKAARIVDAAQGRPVWDFSMRRVHGLGPAVGVARSAYIAGCAGTATVAAGRALNIPTNGTMAHQYVLGFGEDAEQQAFEQFLGDFPSRSVLLVDTYDTPRGVQRAVAASVSTGVALGAIRIDSGDIAELARQARQILDAAGMRDTQIVASNDLDEYKIAGLLAAGAPLDSFGVGTMLGTSADAPALGGVYKLVAQEQGGKMVGVMKRSHAKATDPGVHQVWRARCVDTIGLAGEDLEGRKMLSPVMVGGKPLRAPLALDVIRDVCRYECAKLPQETKQFRNPELLEVRRSAGLVELVNAMRKEEQPV